MLIAALALNHCFLTDAFAAEYAFFCLRIIGGFEALDGVLAIRNLSEATGT